MVDERSFPFERKKSYDWLESEKGRGDGEEREAEGLEMRKNRRKANASRNGYNLALNCFEQRRSKDRRNPFQSQIEDRKLRVTSKASSILSGKTIKKRNNRNLHSL